MVDLPKLKTIFFKGGSALGGDGPKVYIKNWLTFDCTLVMRSTYRYYAGIYDNNI